MIYIRNTLIVIPAKQWAIYQVIWLDHFYSHRSVHVMVTQSNSACGEIKQLCKIIHSERVWISLELNSTFFSCTTWLFPICRYAFALCWHFRSSPWCSTTRQCTGIGSLATASLLHWPNHTDNHIIFNLAYALASLACQYMRIHSHLLRFCFC